MGTTIKLNMLNEETNIYRLVVYCSVSPELKSAAVPINLMLAKKLVHLNSFQRTMKIEKCFNDIVSELPENAVVCGIDVMFNPKYHIDILRILVEANKHHKFRLIWPGYYYENKLIYGEEGFADYKTFEISDYDVLCVI